MLLLDHSMPGAHTKETLRHLVEMESQLRTILITERVEQADVVTALQLGARGVITKDSDSEILFRAIRKVTAGEYWISRASVADLVGAVRSLVVHAREGRTRKLKITPRQQEIIASVVAGNSNKQIAQQFSLSEDTVKRHLTNIYAKLQVSGKAGLLLDQMLQIAGNMGNTPEYRAVNWLAVSGFDIWAPVLGTRKMGFDIYRVLGVMQGYSTNDNSPFRVPGTYQFSGLSTSMVAESPRTIVNVVLHFRELTTGTAVNWFCQADVTGEYPFMARSFTRYYSNP